MPNTFYPGQSDYIEKLNEIAADSAATLRSTLSASTGSSLVGFQQSGTGAVARTVQDKERETVSALDFGALGDGTGALASADFVAKANSFYATSGALYLQEPRFRAGWDTQDFVALQLAIDSASATGKTLLIPAGTYILTKCLIVKRANTHIRGEGMFQTILKQQASSNWFPEVSDDSQFLVGGNVYASTNYSTGRNWSATGAFTVDGFTIEDVGIVGDMTIPALLQSGLQIQGQPTAWAVNTRISRCCFSGHGECGIEPTFCDRITIEGCYFTGNGWQAIGTDHAIKNALITKNIAYEPATGSSESAFLDLEAGTGYDYENIVVSNNVHVATVSGFVKVHPRTNANIKGLVISGNYSRSAGATTLGFYGQYWTGTDTAWAYGNVSDVTITGNTIVGYAVNVFRVGASDSGSGKALQTVISGNVIETATAAASNSVCFDLPKLVEDCVISNNVVKLQGTQQYFSRISWASATDATRICKNITFSGNDVVLKAASYMIDLYQVDGLKFHGNRFDASGTTLSPGGGFLGMQPGGLKKNITVRGNSITLGSRAFILTFYQRVTNLRIEDNSIFATTPDSDTRTLFAINQQVSGCSIRGNRIEAGAQPILMVGDGVGVANAALKIDNVAFVDNDVTHACTANAFEVRQCNNFTFSRNRVNATAGGSGLYCPLYTTTAHLLLEGSVEVSDNVLNGLGSGSNRIGIRLDFNQGGAQDTAIVTGNMVKAAAGSYLSYPICVEGNPRTVGVFSNICHGVENAASRYGVTITGSTATPKIEACVVGNLTHGGASTLAVNTDTNVNLTETGNRLSVTY